MVMKPYFKNKMPELTRLISPGFAVARLKDAVDVYYCPNPGPELQLVPDFDIPPDFEHVVTPFPSGRSYNQLLGPHRYIEVYAWMAYIPLQPHYVYPFDRLSLSPQAVLQGPDVYGLAKETVQSWQDLSDRLALMVHRLIVDYKIRAVAPYTPMGWGCHRKFKSYAKAMRTFHHARDWFLVWAGLVTFLLRHIESETKGWQHGSFLPPKWDVWMARQGYSAMWIDGWRSISSSPVPRAGSVLPSLLSDDIFQRRGLVLSPLDLYLENKIPVWYRWDQQTATYFETHPADLRHQYTPPANVRELCLVNDFFGIQRLYPPLTDEDLMPAIPDGSWQRHVQPIERYSEEAIAARRKFMEAAMERVQATEAALIARETPLEKQRRESRARSRGLRTAAVFVWEIDDEDPCKLVRTSITQRQKEDTFDMYEPSQMKYFPAQNSWHLCDALGPLLIRMSGLGGDDSDEEDPEMPYPPRLPELPHDTPLEDLPAPHLDATLPTERFQTEDTMGEQDSVSTQEAVLDGMCRQITRDVREVLGFTHPIPLGQETLANLPEKEAAIFMRTLGWSFPRNKANALRFLKTPLSYAIYELYRVFTGDHWQGTQATPYFDLNPAAPQTLDFLRSNIRVKIVERGDAKMYILTINNNPNHIAVFSPVVAVSLCRVVPCDNEAAIAYLYDIGAHFHTFLAKPPIWKCAPNPFHYVLPQRQRSFVFDQQEYTNYIHTVHSMLSMERTQAAAMRGGYVWRIASNVIRLEDITDGPTKTAQMRFEHGGTLYYDDELTSTEVLMIIGTYDILEEGTNYSARVSWWPPPDLWDEESTGENYGVWSEYNEAGYHARLRKIREGTAKPLSRSEWKKQIRGIGPCQKWRKSLQARSELALAKMPSL